MNEKQLPTIGKKCPWMERCTVDCALFIEDEHIGCTLVVLARLLFDFNKVTRLQEEGGKS